MAKKHKYVAEVVIETDEPVLKKDLKWLVEELLENYGAITKVRVRSVDAD